MSSCIGKNVSPGAGPPSSDGSSGTLFTFGRLRWVRIPATPSARSACAVSIAVIRPLATAAPTISA